MFICTDRAGETVALCSVTPLDKGPTRMQAPPRLSPLRGTLILVKSSTLVGPYIQLNRWRPADSVLWLTGYTDPDGGMGLVRSDNQVGKYNVAGISIRS